MTKSYVEFQLSGRTAKTNKYLVISKRKRTTLGRIQWAITWRQYVFESACIEGYSGFSYYEFSRGCMREICTFIDNLMIEQRKGLHGLERKKA